MGGLQLQRKNTIVHNAPLLCSGLWLPLSSVLAGNEMCWAVVPLVPTKIIEGTFEEEEEEDEEEFQKIQLG